MAKTVRVGGIVTCEVGDMASTFYYPPFPRYVDFCEKIAALLKLAGNDTEISFHIFKICKALKHFSFAANVSQQIIHETEEAKQYTVNLCLLLDSLTEPLLNNNLMSQDDISELRTQFQTHPISENILIFQARMIQVWCKRLR